ncbi:STN domain-containing protein [Cupriavidus sp. SW-Y-13]|uniref:STN domain-containing protein n=1 Tax=Cupriavidus sp. SW-Y-13 TaxID=2653854 RepID=UPI001EFF84E5|nr:secretin and TonB N-terminal domain-containing protein [Cupriavidus sp. SW-Y-13]
MALAATLPWMTFARAAEMVFDLPAQPLKLALDRYDAQTSMSVFYPSELADGRTSHAVVGAMTPRDALHRLLEGTGLAAHATAGDAFVLAPSGDTPVSPATQDASVARQDYDALVQSRVRQALCARPALALGSYRLAVTVQIGRAGRVQRARLLDTTGDNRRDAAIVDTLQQIDMGRAPEKPDTPFVLLVRQCVAGQACVPACGVPRGMQ